MLRGIAKMLRVDWVVSKFLLATPQTAKVYALDIMKTAKKKLHFKFFLREN